MGDDAKAAAQSIQSTQAVVRAAVEGHEWRAWRLQRPKRDTVYSDSDRQIARAMPSAGLYQRTQTGHRVVSDGSMAGRVRGAPYMAKGGMTAIMMPTSSSVEPACCADMLNL